MVQYYRTGSLRGVARVDLLLAGTFADALCLGNGQTEVKLTCLISREIGKVRSSTDMDGNLVNQEQTNHSKMAYAF